MIVIQKLLVAFKGAPQVTGCEALFTMLGCRDQLVLLLLYYPLFCIATSLPELLDSISG